MSGVRRAGSLPRYPAPGSARIVDCFAEQHRAGRAATRRRRPGRPDLVAVLAITAGNALRRVRTVLTSESFCLRQGCHPFYGSPVLALEDGRSDRVRSLRQETRTPRHAPMLHEAGVSTNPAPDQVARFFPGTRRRRHAFPPCPRQTCIRNQRAPHVRLHRSRSMMAPDQGILHAQPIDRCTLDPG